MQAKLWAIATLTLVLSGFSWSQPLQAQPILETDKRNLDLLIPTKRANVRQLLSTGQCPKCDLSGVNLRDTDLRGADLSGANLNLADLSQADLTNANLENATLIFTQLESAVLNQANLRGAILSSEKLGPVESLNGAILPDGTVVQPSDGTTVVEPSKQK